MDGTLITAILTFVTAAGGGLTVVVGKLWSVVRTEFKILREELDDCRRSHAAADVKIATLETLSKYVGHRVGVGEEVESRLSDAAATAKELAASIPPRTNGGHK